MCAASRLDSQYAFEQESGVVGGYSQTGTTINGIGAIGTLAAAVALGGGLSVLVSEIGTALSSAVSEVYAFAHSLMDYSISRFEDRQPRVHHVIPKNKFTHFGSETVNQINYMHSLLESVGLSVDSPDNLLIISHGTHKSMHTKTYISNIYSIMVCAEPNNKASVEWALFLARIYAASLDQYPCGY